MGRGSAAAMFDGDLLPLQRIPPQYPRDAARGGITGWVQLEVLVNADGSVRSARVLDAKPQGHLRSICRAGRHALEVQAEDQGRQAVEQRGAQKIEFNLNELKHRTSRAAPERALHARIVGASACIVTARSVQPR